MPELVDGILGPIGRSVTLANGEMPIRMEILEDVAQALTHSRFWLKRWLI